jgi:trehalose-phosphatase
VRPGPPPLVCLDYDGTLVPIVRRPEAARLSPAMRRVLRRAQTGGRLRLAVVSGRALAWLRRRVGVAGMILIGNHGFEIAGPGLRYQHPGARRSLGVMRRIVREARRALAGIPGVLIEDKRVTVSLHWRGVPPGQVDRLRRLARGVLRPWERRRAVRVTTGKRVLEVRPPVAWDKGRAVAWLRRALGVAPSAVWYIGDDTTDEDAFRTVNRGGGVSVRVGGRTGRSAARWRVTDAGDVRELVGRLARARGAA